MSEIFFLPPLVQLVAQKHFDYVWSSEITKNTKGVLTMKQFGKMESRGACMHGPRWPFTSWASQSSSYSIHQLKNDMGLGMLLLES